MLVQGLVTTSHAVIRGWVEERSGRPVSIRKDVDGQVEDELGFAFAGRAESPSAHPISWEEFWLRFEVGRLAFVYQDRTAQGELSFSYSLL